MVIAKHITILLLVHPEPPQELLLVIRKQLKRGEQGVEILSLGSHFEGKS